MAKKANRKDIVLMTDIKRRACECDARTIAFYRRNPCIACEELLGIKLFDAQKYILQGMWNASHSLICCSRNFGKSFVGAILMLLKALLYENQAIYIVSSVGDQSKQTFSKLEEICLRIGITSATIRSLKDIAAQEVKKNISGHNGFLHNPGGYHVEFYNGSEIFTLNGSPDSNRSRRASMIFFDEAAYCSDELIAVCEAFGTQSTDFVTDISSDYNPDIEPRKVPTQLVYASSQSEMDKMYYRHYKTFTKRMLAGDRNYFACDLICETAIKTFMDGKPYKPLLERSKVDTALAANKEKALREYYNKPTMDGGISQIVKWATIRRNERDILPILQWTGDKYVLAFDPARINDNSIVGVMRLYEDEEFGWCGDIINIVSLIDIASKKHYKLDTNRQLEEVQNLLIQYNGQNPDYEFIDSLMIDSGSGGGGTTSYGDGMLGNWKDRFGKEHRGLIDKTYELYDGYSARYPDAVNILRLINPKKYRSQMVEEFIELMNLGVIRFPYEWSGGDFVRRVIGVDKKTGEEIFTKYELSMPEQLALAQIDLTKNEITSIHKRSNPEGTSITYALSKEDEHKKHDDRFYVSIMLAHRLYELRRGNIIRNRQNNSAPPPLCVSAVSF